MNKKTLILIPLIAVLIVIASLVILDQRQTPAWRARLNQYLTFLHESGQSPYKVISTAVATAPANFSPAMSAESYSDSLIFQTTYNINADVSVGLEPMPYPPDELMCVLLEVNGQRELVYVALHNNLYNADWIVHISSEPWGSPTLKSQLTSLGCSLDT